MRSATNVHQVYLLQALTITLAEVVVAEFSLLREDSNFIHRDLRASGLEQHPFLSFNRRLDPK